MESLSDIVAEMRTRSREVKEAFGGRPDGVENMLDIWADRIEEAAKREKTEKHETLAVGGIIEVPLHKPSNAAALYEVLHWVKERMIAAIYDGSFDCHEALDKIDAALSAPARNCDKMPDIDNLTMHDLAKSPCKSTLEYASREELLALVRWLLAPAAERKGEGDGR